MNQNQGYQPNVHPPHPSSQGRMPRRIMRADMIVAVILLVFLVFLIWQNKSLNSRVKNMQQQVNDIQQKVSGIDSTINSPDNLIRIRPQRPMPPTP